MPDDNSTVQRQLATEIVVAYVRRNQFGSDQLPGLIATVHQALGQLGKQPEPIAERTPAVPVRRSVHRDHVICLDCGWRGQMLRRHLMTRHGLGVEQYRTRWNLQPDHPITAPGYSERRSTMAKQIGLGQHGRATAKSAAPAQSASRRRGRPRSKATSTAPA